MVSRNNQAAVQLAGLSLKKTVISILISGQTLGTLQENNVSQNRFFFNISISSLSCNILCCVCDIFRDIGELMLIVDIGNLGAYDICQV